jgi:CRISPR-associated protein Cmr3
MNTILLQPTDVLFFRDGRPMEGSLAGHGAAWPLPNVTDAAFHAALHRSGLNGHAHAQRRGAERNGKDNRRFGSLITAGPFPVRSDGTWFFPRPLDLLEATLRPALLPAEKMSRTHSSLPEPLKYPIANTLPPTKDSRAKAWLSAAAYAAYLTNNPSYPPDPPDPPHSLDDSAFCDPEATIGIAIDPATGTTGHGETQGKIYSARYLRLRDGWRLGVFAMTAEKNGAPDKRRDLIPDLLTEQQQILVGGQQRLCTATRVQLDSLPLPRGKTSGFTEHNGKSLVKWILLSPAIWPEIPAQSKDGRPMTPHPGGWLPNWVSVSDGQVMLRSGQRQRRSYNGKHTRGYAEDSKEIGAKLVAAIVPKPIPVTGWALTVEDESSAISNSPSEIRAAGAKSTHLAVPAGAVYYFEADSAEAAAQLAAALNWHGPLVNPSDPADPANYATIRNRRSSLLGEKGFGLGVCGTWQFYPSDPSDQSAALQQPQPRQPTS